MKISEEAECYRIVVEDDGIGFDVTEKLSDRKVHLGIENARGCLKRMCHANLEICSQKGVRTKAAVTIPKTEQA